MYNIYTHNMYVIMICVMSYVIIYQKKTKDKVGSYGSLSRFRQVLEVKTNHSDLQLSRNFVRLYRALRDGPSAQQLENWEFHGMVSRIVAPILCSLNFRENKT